MMLITTGPMQLILAAAAAAGPEAEAAIRSTIRQV